MATRKSVKRKAQKTTSEHEPIRAAHWTIRHGELKRQRGNPGKVKSLLSVVAEKIPFEVLKKVESLHKKQGLAAQGVYIAHDSIGTPRYIGRGNIFQRLAARLKAQPQELVYFSFYVIREKMHERELETILIRAAGPSLLFNDRKKRVDIEPGNVRDYEAGTHFFERQKKKGRKRAA